MAFTPLKSEHARKVTVLQGGSYIAWQNCQGSEYPRDGRNDPLLPFVINFDTQIPNANVTYDVPASTNGVVWAFPVNAIPVTSVGDTRPTRLIDYRKPRF